MSAPLQFPIPLSSPPRFLVGSADSRRGMKAREFYRLPNVWCLHAYRYHADLLVNNHPLAIRPGTVGIIPPDASIEFRFRKYPSSHAFIHFALPPAEPTVLIPAMQKIDLGFEAFRTGMERVISRASSNPARAQAQLWELLWQLADRAAAAGQRLRHPAIDQLLEIVELRLGDRLRVRQLAADLGLSHNHLTRIFFAEMGMTIIAYIRRRRIERARHLLTHSNRPIKLIAAEVGLADLQQFNKLVRRELQASPRTIRSAASPA